MFLSAFIPKESVSGSLCLGESGPNWSGTKIFHPRVGQRGKNDVPISAQPPPRTRPTVAAGAPGGATAAAGTVSAATEAAAATRISVAAGAAHGLRAPWAEGARPRAREAAAADGAAAAAAWICAPDQTPPRRIAHCALERAMRSASVAQRGRKPASRPTSKRCLAGLPHGHRTPGATSHAMTRTDSRAARASSGARVPHSRLAALMTWYAP